MPGALALQVEEEEVIAELPGAEVLKGQDERAVGRVVGQARRAKHAEQLELGVREGLERGRRRRRVRGLERGRRVLSEARAGRAEPSGGQRQSEGDDAGGA